MRQPRVLGQHLTLGPFPIFKSQICSEQMYHIVTKANERKNKNQTTDHIFGLYGKH
jgi:hypothetical protein